MKTPHRILRGIAWLAVVLLGASVFVMGALSSFQTLSAYAAGHGWRWGPAFPLGLDAAVPALLILDWLRPRVFLRGAAWALAIGTVAANGSVVGGSPRDRAFHALMPALAVIIIEAARRLRSDETRRDRIGAARWLLAPVRTALLWRRMVLWQITSYDEALTRESAILHARTVLAVHYGQPDWRRTRNLVPLTLRHQLATGQLPDRVLHSLDLETSVRMWVVDTLTELAPAPEPVPLTAAQTEADQNADPEAADRARWDRVWVRRDSIRPDEVSAGLFATAHALMRDAYEQASRHMTKRELRDQLRIAKPTSDLIHDKIRSAFESGSDRPDQNADQRTGTMAAPGAESGPLFTDLGPAGLTTGLNGYEFAVQTGAGESS